MEKARLDKIIAGEGTYSRREVRLLVRQGRVLVDGVPARSPEDKVVPEAVEIMVDGTVLHCRRYTWIMLHKPAGVLSATEDGRGATVLDLLPPELRRQQVQHCGPPAVLRGGEDPRRLMKHDPGVAAAVQHGPVHHNLHCLRHHLVLRRPGRHTVHQHPALADQEPHFPPGVCPLPGDDLVQTRFLHAGLLLADLCLFLPLLFPRDEHGRLSSDGLFCFILS